MASNLTWWAARDLAIAGTPIRRSGWVDRWVSYDLCLWWVTPYDPITKLRSERTVIIATGWSRSEFLASDWTTEEPSAKELPVTLTWTLPKEASVILGKFAESSFKNPFSGVAKCEVSATGFDDDVYIPKIGQYLFGIDHASKGVYSTAGHYVSVIGPTGTSLPSWTPAVNVNDPAKRTSVSFSVAAGEAVVLQAFDAVKGSRGGVVTLTFSVA